MPLLTRSRFPRDPQMTPASFSTPSSTTRLLARLKWFRDNESAYQKVQASKTRTLGFAMHDSPVGMLAWMADKLFTWTDAYPGLHPRSSPGRLLHYFPGPTTGFQMYRENLPPRFVPPSEMMQGNYVKIPTGVSAFAKELLLVPRGWVEKEFNLVFWKEHEKGGHFAAWERPDQLAEDVISFVQANWSKE